MDRSKKKVTKEGLKFIIENWNTKSSVALGAVLGVDHTTVLYWAKMLRDEGFDLPPKKKLMNQQRAAIEELKTEYGLATPKT